MLVIMALMMMMKVKMTMQVWGYWGSVPTDIPASQPLVLGFNEPDHENQVEIMNQQDDDGKDYD